MSLDPNKKLTLPPNLPFLAPAPGRPSFSWPEKELDGERAKGAAGYGRGDGSRGVSVCEGWRDRNCRGLGADDARGSEERRHYLRV